MKTIQNPAQVRLVLEEIAAAREEEAAAKERKLRVIRLGREHNIPWQTIADRLGVTDSAVIRLMQRADAA